MINTVREMLFICAIVLFASALTILSVSETDAQLPSEVKAVWDLGKAYREKTPTRERICLNGLWRWQPVKDVAESVPTGNWGYFKVPGSWPGITNYMQKDSQTIFFHSSWRDENLHNITAAWYQREITILGEWGGRSITVYMEYLNSFAVRN